MFIFLQLAFLFYASHVAFQLRISLLWSGTTTASVHLPNDLPWVMEGPSVPSVLL